MEQLRFDIVIIGTGIGAASIAHRLSRTGASVAMVPGVGRSRFKQLDGGLMLSRQLEDAFGTSMGAPIRSNGNIRTVLRHELEAWAIDLVRPHVTILGDFEDHKVVPIDADTVALQEESGRREIIARQLILTEGASPKIGIAAGIRPDFEPEDLIHFGRTVISDASLSTFVSGSWRTTWGMPAWYSAIPHPDGAIVSASARIENIMRAGKDGREVLADFLQSTIARDVGLPDSAGTIGMELVPLRQAQDGSRVQTSNMVITPDANGSVDARSLERFAIGLRTSVGIGAIIAREWPNTPDWDEVGKDFWNVPAVGREPYHDSRETGFIEDGAGKPAGILRKLFKR